MAPKLSVVFPVLNNRAGFVRAIDGVLALGRSDIELIVIDGGSIDGTLDEVTARLSFLSYWESGRDSGIADAFNRGVERASGQYVAILNSDDYWAPGAFSAFEKALTQSPNADVYYGAIRYVDQERQYSYVRRPNFSALKYRMWLFHPAIIVSRASYERVGLYDPVYSHAMDCEWCHRAISKGERFVEIDEVIANMSLGGVSDREYFKSLQQYRESLLHHGICGRLESFIYYHYFLTAKLVMRSSLLRPVKILRDKILASHR